MKYSVKEEEKKPVLDMEVKEIKNENIKGVGEGTVAAAILVGLLVKLLDKMLAGFFHRIGLDEPAESGKKKVA